MFMFIFDFFKRFLLCVLLAAAVFSTGFAGSNSLRFFSSGSCLAPRLSASHKSKNTELFHALESILLENSAMKRMWVMARLHLPFYPDLAKMVLERQEAKISFLERARIRYFNSDTDNPDDPYGVFISFIELLEALSSASIPAREYIQGRAGSLLEKLPGYEPSAYNSIVNQSPFEAIQFCSFVFTLFNEERINEYISCGLVYDDVAWLMMNVSCRPHIRELMELCVLLEKHLGLSASCRIITFLIRQSPRFNTGYIVKSMLNCLNSKDTRTKPDELKLLQIAQTAITDPRLAIAEFPAGRRLLYAAYGKDRFEEYRPYSPPADFDYLPAVKEILGLTPSAYSSSRADFTQEQFLEHMLDKIRQNRDSLLSLFGWERDSGGRMARTISGASEQEVIGYIWEAVSSVFTFLEKPKFPNGARTELYRFTYALEAAIRFSLQKKSGGNETTLNVMIASGIDRELRQIIEGAAQVIARIGIKGHVTLNLLVTNLHGSDLEAARKAVRDMASEGLPFTLNVSGVRLDNTKPAQWKALCGLYALFLPGGIDGMTALFGGANTTLKPESMRVISEGLRPGWVFTDAAIQINETQHSAGLYDNFMTQKLGFTRVVDYGKQCGSNRLFMNTEAAALMSEDVEFGCEVTTPFPDARELLDEGRTAYIDIHVFKAGELFAVLRFNARKVRGAVCCTLKTVHYHETAYESGYPAEKAQAQIFRAAGMQAKEVQNIFGLEQPVQFVYPDQATAGISLETPWSGLIYAAC